MAAHPPLFTEVGAATLSGLSPSASWDRLTWDAAGARLFLGLKADGLVYLPFATPGLLRPAAAAAVAGTDGANGLVIAGDSGLAFAGDGAGSTGACDDGSSGCRHGVGIRVLNLTGAVPTVIATLTVAGGVGVLNGAYDSSAHAVWLALANGSAVVVNVSSLALTTVHVVPGCASPAEPCEPLSHPTYDAAAAAVYAAARDQNAIVRIPTSTRAATRFDVSVYGCFSPRGLDIDPLRQHLFIGCSAPDNPLLLVLNALTMSMVASVPIGRGNDGVVYDAAAHAIYASSGTVGTISVIQQSVQGEVAGSVVAYALRCVRAAPRPRAVLTPRFAAR